MEITAVTLIGILSIGIFGVPSVQGTLPSFNDPKFGEQFYLNERFGVTMNIYKAWNQGYTGRGVTICIIDPAGVEKDHAEIASKFVTQGSFDYQTNSSDPTPDSGGIFDGPNAHGTKMAGLAAASANNGICGVGVAYDASVSGMKMLLNKGSSLNENRLARLMAYGNQINDIYSCSWGRIDFYHSKIGYMSQVVQDSIRRSAEQGRGGKGNIYLFAAGNGGLFNGTCSYDEYRTSIYTILISVVTGKNVRSNQNVKCAAISAVTYSRDSSLGINYPHDLMPTCGLRNGCVRTTGASSAATAVASGIMALVLHANPNLGWRDVQHLIARTSSSKFNSVPWRTNKAGLRVSDDFGFGLLDAYALTTTAKNWSNVGPQLNCSIKFTTPEPIDGIRTTTKTVDMTTWPASCGGETKRINYLEHVVLEISLNFTARRNIEIEITSPGGTPSIILRSGRRMDILTELKNLSPMSLHYWGENPRGIWNIALRNVNPNPSDSGMLFNWSLKFYGTSEDPLASNRIVNDTLSPNTVNNTATPTQQTKSGLTLLSTLFMAMIVQTLFF